MRKVFLPGRRPSVSPHFSLALYFGDPKPFSFFFLFSEILKAVVLVSETVADLELFSAPGGLESSEFLLS